MLFPEWRSSVLLTDHKRTLVEYERVCELVWDRNEEIKRLRAVLYLADHKLTQQANIIKTLRKEK